MNDERVNTPVVVAALVVAAALFAFLSWHHDASAQASAIGFTTTALALFLRADKRSPAPRDTSGAGLPRAGNAGTSIVPQDDDGLKLKKELLFRWAAEGKSIDDSTEMQAELLADDVAKRSKAWRDYPDTAPNQTVKDSEKEKH